MYERLRTGSSGITNPREVCPHVLQRTNILVESDLTE
jgi:hypothetical protein